jgi:hypothetical protein
MAHGSLDQFKAFLRRKKDRKNKVDGKFDTSDLAQSEGDLEFPEPSEVELNSIKSTIRKNASRRRMLDKVLLGIVIACAIGFLVYLNYFT